MAQTTQLNFLWNNWWKSWEAQYKTQFFIMFGILTTLGLIWERDADYVKNPNKFHRNQYLDSLSIFLEIFHVKIKEDHFFAIVGWLIWLTRIWLKEGYLMILVVFLFFSHLLDSFIMSLKLLHNIKMHLTIN